MDSKSLIHSRGSLKAKLSSLERFLDEKFKDATVSELLINELQLRIKHCDGILERFNEIQGEIEALNDNPEFIDVCEREAFESRYFVIFAKVQAYLSSGRAQDNISESTPSIPNFSPRNRTGGSCVRLPRIELPSFDGDYTKYREFCDVFKALVDSNESTSDAEKLCYLKMCTKGEAAGLLASFDTTDSNYKVAFELLNDRYDNTRLTIHNHVQKLLNLEAVTKESHIALRNLIDSAERHLRALRNFNQPIDGWDAIIVPIIAGKLDQNSLKAWESKINEQDKSIIPTYKELIAFLNIRQGTLESLASKTSQGERAIKQLTKRFTAHIVDRKNGCALCGAEHMLYRCKKFLDLPVHERVNRIKRLKLCINCMNGGHYANICKSSGCKTCGGKHNTLLHYEKNRDGHLVSNEQQEPVTVEQSQREISFFSPNTSNSWFNKSKYIDQVILSTALVKFIGKGGRECIARALLDNASTSCLMSEEFSNKLGLMASDLEHPIPISGIGNSETIIKRQIYAQACSVFGQYKFNTTYLVISHITDTLPLESFDISMLQIPYNIQLADPQLNRVDKIDVLLGASVFWDLLKHESIKVGTGNLRLTNTHLGWILGGCFERTSNGKKHISCVSLKRLHKDLQRFWEVDEIGSTSILSADESYCESHFQSTHNRDERGNFIVRLPFKLEHGELGDSLEIALKRFKSLENKLSRNPEFKIKYSQFLKEYKEMGHMQKVEVGDSVPRIYLPHHGVIKENSITTKLRVVFDASCKTSTGISLNDTLSVGPVVQRDLFSILNDFRVYPYVITGDIEKMYRMIQIHPDDRRFQCILWRDNDTSSIDTYELCTVTYGTASASFLATRCILQLAELYESPHPVESRIIKNNFYVDDLLFGANTVQELNQQREVIRNILDSGGFNLRKWRSNVPELNEAPIPLKFDEIKILGILWDSEADILTYQIDDISTRITKRAILATTAKLFDPLEIWLQHFGWDEAITGKLADKWCEFRSKLRGIAQIRVPRSAVHIELVTDLTTDSFIAAMRRFVARRGKPSEIISDNGTNFVGAERALRELVNSSSDKIAKALISDGIQWRFIPARSPHMGGLWESNIKILKNYLFRVVGNNILTLESMQTLITQIESMLNSRPLCPVSNDHLDLEPLTPGHFLIGRPLNMLPSTTKPFKISEYNLVQKMFEDIWSRWRKEYLHTLQFRYEWQKNGDSPKIGELVLLIEDNSPPMKWKLGKIFELHPGRDGVVRTVSIRTPSGTTRRSIHKICFLPKAE